MMIFFQESIDMAAKQAQGASIYAKYLKGMNATWDKMKKESAKGAVEVPVGTWICRLKSIKLREYDVKDDNGKVVGKCLGALGQFIVLVGDYAGEQIPWFPKFTDDEKIMYFMRDLRKLGAPVDDFDALALEGQLKALTAAKPGARIKNVAGNNGGVFARIDTGLSEEQIAAFGGAAMTETVTDGGEEVAADGEEPEIEIEAEPAPVVTKKVAAPAPAAARAAVKAPVVAAGGSARPPKKAAPAAAPADPDEPEIEIGGEEEPEIEIETEAAEPEIEIETEPVIEAGSRIQWSSKGKVFTGLVKALDDTKQRWAVRLEGGDGKTMAMIPYNYPGVVVAD